MVERYTKMSREIKFRAWDKKRKRYAKVIQTTNQGWKGYRDKTYITNGIMRFSKWVLSRFVIEQYAGLKDKNDKEIYEGDIVEEDIDFNSKMTDGTFRYKVYWNNDELCWSLDPIGPESIHNDLWELNSSCRVIGNIHENPELLGGGE